MIGRRMQASSEAAGSTVRGGVRLPPDAPVSQTRWLSLFITTVLVAAVALLWVVPGRTDELWAWPVKPKMTPLFMASAYAAGAYFFARGWRTRHWHRISSGFPGIAVFAAMMFVATLIHWDKFNHGDGPFFAAATFYGWTVLYAISPLLVGWVWVRNRGVDNGAPESVDAVVPQGLRAVAAVGGAAAVALGSLIYLVPSVGVHHWPWTLSPLTARVIASFVVEGGLVGVFLGRDRRWSAWRILTQTAAIGSLLVLVGAARAWDDWDRGALTWLFLAILGATVVGAGALHLQLDRKQRPAAPDR